jgi:hypothetical protein
MRMFTGRRIASAAGIISVLPLLGACDNDTAGFGVRDDQCSIPADLIIPGGPGKDGIPALSNPQLVGAETEGAAYLRDADRVIGLLIGSAPVAVPLNIGWWHEIVNLEVDGVRVAVTHCPLTGSSLAFDRAAIGGAEFGVSGLLYRNNPIMYDRTSSESLWPQMLRGARCGPRDGAALSMAPVIEMNWSAWKQLHPDTRVVSSATGVVRNYQAYPYGDYDRIDNAQLLFPISRLDTRRPPKERVLGIPSGESGGVAFPFGALSAVGPVAVVETVIDGGTGVVFWDATAGAAMAYVPRAGDQDLLFEIRDGRIADTATGSIWTVGGVAVTGPLAGTRLPPVAEAYVVTQKLQASVGSAQRVFLRHG